MHELKKTLYCNAHVKVPLSSYAIVMTYFELLDETHADFKQLHDCCEIYFCLENNLIINAGGREYVLSPGEFLLIMPGMPHNVVYTSDEKKKYLCMMFQWPKIEKGTEQNRPLASKICKLASLDFATKGSCSLEKIMTLLDKMEMELDVKDSGWFLLFRGFCLEFLIYCLREVIEPITTSAPREMSSINEAIAITKFMHKNYSKQITFRDVANAIHMSPRHAQRVFKDFFGISFNKALALYRLNHAKNYLANSDLTINEIVEQVGLSSPQSLYKLFREQENMSAKEYRVVQKARLQKMQGVAVNEQTYEPVDKTKDKAKDKAKGKGKAKDKTTFKE